MEQRKRGGKGGIRPEDGKQFSKDYQPEEKWTEEKALELGNELLDWMNEVGEDGEDKGNMFVDEFFVIKKRLYYSLPNYLAKKFTSFSKLYDTAKKTQEVKLMKYGVGDRLNATMTKFTLINNHGWKDRTETDVISGGEKIKQLPTVIFKESE